MHRKMNNIITITDIIFIKKYVSNVDSSFLNTQKLNKKQIKNSNGL